MELNLPEAQHGYIWSIQIYQSEKRNQFMELNQIGIKSRKGSCKEIGQNIELGMKLR